MGGEEGDTATCMTFPLGPPEQPTKTNVSKPRLENNRREYFIGSFLSRIHGKSEPFLEEGWLITQNFPQGRSNPHRRWPMRRPKIGVIRNGCVFCIQSLGRGIQ